MGGFLHISGDTRVMYVWDAHTETQLLDLSTRELGEAGDDAACQRRTATCRSTRSIHLVVASEVDNITYVVMLRVSSACARYDRYSVFDWSKRTQLTTFHNGNPKGTTITSVQFINQDVGGLILVSYADGMVKLYRNYDPSTSDTPVQMISAYRGLNDIICLSRGSALSSTGTRWEGSYISLAIRASFVYGTHIQRLSC